MAEYRFALPAEEADILDFINFVFSQAYRPHDFKRFCPRFTPIPAFPRCTRWRWKTGASGARRGCCP